MKLERLAIAVLLVVVGGQAVASCVERRGRRADRIAAANALADATQQEDWLKGQLRVAVRYVHQGQVELDETQRERNQQAILATSLLLEARELRGRAATQPLLANDTLRLRTGWGDLDSNGVHVDTDVEITGVAPIDNRDILGSVYYRVAIAPVSLELGFACVGPNGRFYVTGPRYHRLVLKSGVVSPAVCNPPPPAWEPLSIRAPSLPWALALFGLGAYVGSR